MLEMVFNTRLLNPFLRPMYLLYRAQPIDLEFKLSGYDDEN